MARMRFKKPKIAVLMSEVISLTIWLFLGDQVIDVLDNLVGDGSGDVDNSTFEDAFQILGIGNTAGTSNTDQGLLGVIGLVMVVMVLMNFVTYR